MHTAHYRPSSGPDPYPGMIRRSLESSRREGLRWGSAWKRAIAECGMRDHAPTGRDVVPRGRPPRHVDGPYKGCIVGGYMEWLYSIMRNGFLKLDLGAGDVTAMLEDPPEGGPRALKSRPHPPRVTGGPCMWGGEGCSNTAIEGRNFCRGHAKRLSRIARSLVADPGDFTIHTGGVDERVMDYAA